MCKLNLIQWRHFNLKAHYEWLFYSDCSVLAREGERHLVLPLVGLWLLHGEGLTMSGEDHQLMLERMQMLEEALRRAIAGVATTDDWEMICMECGMPRSSIFETEKER